MSWTICKYWKNPTQHIIEQSSTRINNTRCLFKWGREIKVCPWCFKCSYLPQEIKIWSRKCSWVWSLWILEYINNHFINSFIAFIFLFTGRYITLCYHIWGMLQYLFVCYWGICPDQFQEHPVEINSHNKDIFNHPIILLATLNTFTI